VPFLYVDFKKEVFDSVENDERFSGLLDTAINRAIDEVLSESDYGNTEQSFFPTVSGQNKFALSEDMIAVNHVTWDGIPLSIMTMAEYLNTGATRPAFPSNGRPYQYLVQDNNTLIVFPIPNDIGKEIRVYQTLKQSDVLLDADPLPIVRRYTTAAFHFARHWLFSQDNQVTQSEKEYNFWEHEMGKTKRRLNGSRKTKVTRII